jgi:hypothetical protein
MIQLQLWEQFLSDGTIQSDGCSLHIDKISRNEYVLENSHSNFICNERPVGLETEVEVSDEIFEIVSNRKNVRLSEVELNNLVGLKDIIPI